MTYENYLTPDGRAYVRPKINGSASLNDFLKALEESSSFTRADGKGVIDAFAAFLSDRLSTGMSVTIDGVGTFSVVLTTHKTDGTTMLTGNDVLLKRIAFKAHPLLKDAVGQRMTLRHVSPRFHREPLPALSADERRQVLLSLIAEKGEVTSPEYRDATGISSTQAYADLLRAEADGAVKVRRLGNNKLFHL